MRTLVGQDLPGKMAAGLSDVSFNFFQQCTRLSRLFLYALRVRSPLWVKVFTDLRSLIRAAHEIK